jgi:hypothetical protein
MTRSTLAARGEPLSDGQLAVLRSMLEEQRAFRVEQLAQLHLPGPHGPLSSTDPEVFRSLAAGARAALRDVQSALWRMDEGNYGLCTSCGDTIGVERLEILPQSRLCLPCQRVGAAT